MLLVLRCGSLLNALYLVEVCQSPNCFHNSRKTASCNASFILTTRAPWTWWPCPLSSILLGDEQESKLGGVDECIFAACLLNVFTWVVVGFWYFTALARTFYVCFARIPDLKEESKQSIGEIIFGHKYANWRPLKPSKQISTHMGEELS